jgi:imidazoleglycerol-phosphate dehydratase
MARGSAASAESVRVRLDTTGTGHTQVATGTPVLDELLALLARTARFDLAVESHSASDEIGAVGEALGRALADALAEPGCCGLGSATAPADEALASVVVEASGRPLVVSNVDLTSEHVGGFRGDLLARLLEALASSAGLTVHVRLLHGTDTEHVLEAIAKALGLALAEACSR